MAESFDNTQERLKYIRNRLSWKRLFAVIVTDMNATALSLYKKRAHERPEPVSAV